MIAAARSALMAGASLAAFAVAACDPPRSAATPAPAPTSSPASTSAARDTGALLGAARIARRAPAERAAWEGYLRRSRENMARDREAMAAELRAVGAERMTPAPTVRAAFAMRSHMTPDWFRSDSARRLVEIVLSYQTPSGGWSKHVDYTRGPRQPGTSWYAENASWSYIGTLDNQSTTTQVEFLARAFGATGDQRARAGVTRGLEYLIAAQFPNGGWPQVYPLQGGYHDAITFNDDAMVNVLRVLRDVGRAERGVYGFVDDSLRARTAAALARGVDCLLATQVVVDGKRTAWGQQHDPLTLQPVGARSYEHAALSGRESAGIVELLMSLPSPDARVVAAVHDAVDWFRATAIHGYAYDFEGGRREQAGAGPIWARMTEIGTNRPIFSNRDGVKLYDYEQLGDRRRGYAWYSTEPAGVLEKYERWSARYPRR